ncbi:molybdenum cofactor biosynthesis protein MoaE [Mucilaginibacter sp. AW1-3]
MIPSAYSPQAAEDEIPALSAMPLDVVGLLAQAHHPEAGAVVLFSGEVRNHNQGQDVDYLEYEAHEAMAAKMIKNILNDACAKWPLKIAVAQHRTGKVTIGETAVIVITASAHRGEAYEANQYIIHRIKHEATIWKCEYFTDGTKKWGGNCSCCPPAP